LRSTTELQTQKRVRLDLNQRLKTAISSTNTASDDLNKPVSQKSEPESEAPFSPLGKKERKPKPKPTTLITKYLNAYTL